MFGTTCERELADAKRRADDLQYDLDREREAREHRIRLEDRERRQRQQERREQAAQTLCKAGNWPEAFDKQKYRLSEELRETVAYNQQLDSTLGDKPMDAGIWERAIAAVSRAEELYEAKQAEIERLQQELLAQVADQMDAEFSDNMVSNSLRRNDPSELLN